MALACSCSTVRKMSSVASAICCTPEPKKSSSKSAAPLGLDRLALDDAARVDDILDRRLPEVEQRGVEEQPAQHFLVLHRLREVIEAGEAGAFVAARLDPLEGHVPEPGAARLFV